MNIGLVLSGGMAKGAFQVGALKALSEFIPAGEIKYISCASVGVLNGYAYATGKIDVAEQIWHGLCDEGEHFSIGKVLKGDLVQRVIEGIYSEEDEVEGKFFASLLDMKNKAVVYKDIASLQEGTVDEFLKASVSLPVYSKATGVELCHCGICVCNVTYKGFEQALTELESLPTEIFEQKALSAHAHVKENCTIEKYEERMYSCLKEIIEKKQ